MVERFDISRRHWSGGTNRNYSYVSVHDRDSRVIIRYNQQERYIRN